MKTLTIAEFEHDIGARPREIETLLTRRAQIGLRSRYAETTSGRERQFSYDNVVELAMIIRLRQAGLGPQSAAAYADLIVRKAKQMTAPEWLLINPADKSGVSTAPKDYDFDAITDDEPMRLVIRVGAIVRRIDGLFQGP